MKNFHDLALPFAPDKPFEGRIRITANFYFKRVLPRAENHFKIATTGSDYIMNFKFN